MLALPLVPAERRVFHRRLGGGLLVLAGCAVRPGQHPQRTRQLDVCPRPLRGAGDARASATICSVQRARLHGCVYPHTEQPSAFLQGAVPPAVSAWLIASSRNVSAESNSPIPMSASARSGMCMRRSKLSVGRRARATKEAGGRHVPATKARPPAEEDALRPGRPTRARARRAGRASTGRGVNQWYPRISSHRQRGHDLD